MTTEPEVPEQKMPKPVAWNILCMVPKADDKFEGTGLLKPDSQKHVEQHSTVVLFVLKLGPEAYKDKERFPGEPWCKEGDFVLVRAYTGTRFKVDGHEYRIIKDDQVEAVVDDPRGVLRA
jgi:co-chaperonin GroES (HSP10)